MSVGVEIPIHEAIIFDLGTTSADRFLKENPPCVFFVGDQIVECLPIPLGFARWGKNTPLLQPSSNFAQAVAAEVTLKNQADNGGFLRVNDQLTVWVGVISIASALGHLGGTILKAFS